MRTDPFSGVVYVFRAKRADRVKLIFWDGTGVVLVGSRHRIGSLLLGYYTPAGDLIYAGRAGTGMPDRELERLWQRLQPLVVAKMWLPSDSPMLGIANEEGGIAK
jgi:hypothetical protein